MAVAHVGHGHALPLKARKLVDPLRPTSENLAAGEKHFTATCGACHGEDGAAHTPLAYKMTPRPANLVDHLMDGMRDGEIWWVQTHGVPPSMPSFQKQLASNERWQVVLWVRELQKRHATEERTKVAGDYEWQLPSGFPYPKIPGDDPVTMAKVKLGRYLFYDKRLSGNETQSCATCHQQQYAFTDRRAVAIGSTGEMHPRNAMSLANVAYSPALTWANPNMRRLEQQALVPMFGEHPVEMGLAGREQVLIQRVKGETKYGEMFAEAFPNDSNPINLANIVKAIASFERTIISGRSPYDQYRTGVNPKAISKSALRGESLFFSERTECFHCHGGFNFTGTQDYMGKGFAEVEFHNNAIYNLKGEITYPPDNRGLYEFTHDPADAGRFKAPSLRNVAVTGPYMHDGSMQTLSEVLDHYSRGGRLITSGPYAGDGSQNPNRSEFIKAINFTAKEKQDMLAFLKSLTDKELLVDERYSDPWLKEDQRPKHVLRGVVRDIDAVAGTVLIKGGPVDDFMPAMTMEYRVSHPSELKGIVAGNNIEAEVSRKGDEYWLSNLHVISTK